MIGCAFSRRLGAVLARRGGRFAGQRRAGGRQSRPDGFPHLPATAVYLYPLVPIVVALAYAARWGGQLYYAAATVGTIMWGAGYGWQGYRQLAELIVGLDKIIWGVAFFLLAAWSAWPKQASGLAGERRRATA